MRIPGALAALACLVALTAAPTRAQAQTRSITCESRNDDRNDCYVGGLEQGSVSVSRKLSESACTKGTSWGTSRDNIWVSRGCRAVFVEARGGGLPGGGYNPGHGSGYSVTCNSEGERYRACAWDRRQGRPELIEQLSRTPCIEGRSWGHKPGQIWVSHGCRARFGITSGSGGNRGNGNGPTVACQSNNRRYRECNTGMRGRVELVTMFPNSAACTEGRTWGQRHPATTGV